MTDGRAIPEIFGENVFNDAVMKRRLPKYIYKKLKKIINEGGILDRSIADPVAAAMRDWAIEKGATHYAHWFQPMTGVTAEKHDSFISPVGNGKIIMEFKGKELIQGEPDASSFPSGGIRETFEARGYTAWDCTSPAFVKKDGQAKALYIPTAFYSHTGDVLDKKTPLLRSMDALSKQALRVLRVLGDKTSTRVVSTSGPEQEYFLIDKKYYDQRLDLIVTGRTLFGAPSPKGQDLNDHYFGSISERVAAYMQELDRQLWSLGIPAKTKHNEVAPAQYELAIVFMDSNVATDANQLIMDLMKKIALKHDLVCLLHEKPFAGVNGSGKHNNWSMATNRGKNLLEPGDNPHQNLQFLLFLMAVVKAVDKYASLIRLSAANCGNDHRLGGNEAPPAIISIFLGDQLSDILNQIAKGNLKASRKSGIMEIGVKTLPAIPKDNTDRNRTSPFAFTGNKFEFRMVGSTASISGPNFIINAVVADVLSGFADRLEKAEDVTAEVNQILLETVKKHKKIIFNGDNYSQEWVTEAQRRGLPNITSTVEVLPIMLDKDVIAMFERQKVLTKRELQARFNILADQYAKQINIEALTAITIVKKQIIPAVIRYLGDIAGKIGQIKANVKNVETAAQEKLVREGTKLLAQVQSLVEQLAVAREKAVKIQEDPYQMSLVYFQEVVPIISELRQFVDQLEMIVGENDWPLPSYAQMLLMS